MSGIIKYFENGGINMSFMIEDNSVFLNYNEIWNKINEIKSINFHSNPVYDEEYTKAKVREYNGVINTNILGNKVPKEGVHHTCIACISLDSVMKMDRKNYPHV